MARGSTRTHLRLTAPVAPRALLPEDPALALALAQELLSRPVMSNHTLGLWGYHGETPLGLELTIQATGLTGAGAVIVLEELAAHGVGSAIRIGTCVAAASGPDPGSLLVPREAQALDGASRALGASGVVEPDAALMHGLNVAGAGEEAALVATLDLPVTAGATVPVDADATDLASAPLLALGERLGVAVASVLVVAEAPGSEPLDDQELSAGGLELGRSAAAALRSAATSPAS